MNFLTLRSLRTLRFDKLMGPTTASFSSISPKKIRVIGIPLDLGQSRRGVDMGPSAVRVAGLEARLEALGHVVEDGGNVHGMPLAAIMGLGPPELANIFNFSPKVNPENCVLVGVRDIDAIEKENIRKAGIEVFTMRDIDERGMRTIIEEALRMAGRGTAGYHVSLDMDWIDPEDAPGVGTPVRGGATYREAHLAMEIIADHGRMTSFEIVEVNPVIDEHNRTADLAVELTLSAFGKKIL